MKKQLCIAYLTTTYPAVSHTFIRRELREMERRGHKILRVAIRPSKSPIIDDEDMKEFDKTYYCLSQSILCHIYSLIYIAIFHPLHFLKALKVTFKMGLKSERGLPRHLAYLVEACTLAVVFKKQKVDHVHVHFGTNAATVARLIKYCGGPAYSFTVHGPTEFDSPVSFDLAGKIADAAFIIAISDFCSAQLRRWSNPVDWKKIHLIHCTVGEEFFNYGVPINPNSNTFVSVGRLTPQKGQIVLVEAFIQLIKLGYKANLIFVGDGELRPEIEDAVKTAGIEEYVHITGFVSEAEVRKYISTSRVFIMPSFAEGLPMVIMEAFAIGRPVISTYIAGIPELVKSKENGWLVPAGNLKQLVSVMVDSLTSPVSDITEMALNGRMLTYKNHRTITEGSRLEDIFLSYVV